MEPMMPDQESASLMPNEPPNPAGGMKTESVSIRPAENGGFMVSCSKRSSDGGPSAYNSKDYVFKTLDEVNAYIASELGAAQPTQALPPVASTEGEELA